MTRTVRRAPLLAAIAAGVIAGGIALGVDAQNQLVLPEGMEAELDEARAWEEAQNGHHIKARELAEAVVRTRPNSFVAHFVLGYVHHYGEANFARALYHHNKAYSSMMERHGDPSGPGVLPTAPWRWHARLLRELVWTHGDLEHFEEQIEYMALYSELYEPDLIAERAWPFMKQRRFDDAREAARLGEETGDPQQMEIALNARCAIEFEAGNDEASYEACRRAMELHGADPTQQTAVDFTNFAEAARSVFRLDEAERVGVLATQAQVSWYGNPWVELGELYLREGRYVEALSALREVPNYRRQRPPHVQDADRNEARRALSSFFLVTGRSDDALKLAAKALDAPDRRAHNSRDPAQDRALAALLHRAALRLSAEQRTENAIGAPAHERIYAWGLSLSDRWSGWLSGRIASRNLADEERLIGTYMIGTHRSAVMPPWLVGELTDVLGAGVVREAVRRARAEDVRDGSDAYYDAFEAEAALSSGDPERARELAGRALAALDPAEGLLRGRALAIAAESNRRLGDARRAVDAYGDAFQVDPGVFRRLGWPVPVRYQLSGGEVAETIAEHLADGDRFETEDWGLTVQVRGDRVRAEVCLLDRSDSVISCTEVDASADGEDEDGFAARAAREFLAQVFAPRVDLSQTDANSLDGSNRVSRDPLQTMFGHQPPPRE